MVVDTKAASTDAHGAHGEAPSERRPSVVVDKNLASEEDAAVLAKMGYVHCCACRRRASAWLTIMQLQTRAPSQFQHDRSIRYRVRNHGTAPFNRQHALLLNSSGTCRSCLGLVSCFGLHFHRRPCDGRPWVKHAHKRRYCGSFFPFTPLSPSSFKRRAKSFRHSSMDILPMRLSSLPSISTISL